MRETNRGFLNYAFKGRGEKILKTVFNGVHSVVNENISEPRVKQTIDHVYNQNLLCLFSDL